MEMTKEKIKERIDVIEKDIKWHKDKLNELEYEQEAFKLLLAKQEKEEE